MFSIRWLDNPCAHSLTCRFPHAGRLCEESGYLYLKVSDLYIQTLFAKCNLSPPWHMPSSCVPGGIGAHISVIYKEERRGCEMSLLQSEYGFDTMRIAEVSIVNKMYYVLWVRSEMLTMLRVAHGLSPQPCYKGYSIPFHITFARRAAC